jgi:hypothetical protein
MASAGPGPDLQMVSSNQWNGAPWDEAAHTRAENEAHALVVATSPTFASSVARALDPAVLAPLMDPVAAEPILCPLCSTVRNQAGEREHEFQGCRVFIPACKDCLDKPLCPADLHGAHKGEVICAGDDVDEYRKLCQQYGHIPDFRVGTEPSRVGIAVCCGQMVEWDQIWVPSTTPTIESLNDRYHRGEIDLETHVAGIKAILSVEAED